MEQLIVKLIYRKVNENMIAQERNVSTEFYKPLSIARDDLMDKLIDAANDSGLPLIVIEYVARDFYSEVKNTASMQYEKDKKDYEAELSKSKDDDAKKID